MPEVKHPLVFSPDVLAIDICSGVWTFHVVSILLINHNRGREERIRTVILRISYETAGEVMNAPIRVEKNIT